jgi:FkbM family methyltransferase
LTAPGPIPPRTVFADLRSARNVAIDARVPRAQRRRLVRDFVAMRLRSLLRRKGTGPVRARILDFDVRAFDYETLLFLFDEIFVFQCYRVEFRKERPTILDCGANLGMATLFFKTVAPGARIVAFEPDPTTFALLSENVTANGLEDVELRNQALWSSEGELTFHVADDPGSLLMSVIPQRITGRKVTVPSVPLSPILEEFGEVDLLKLDVEGAETEILDELDGSGALERVREWVVEYHHRIDGSPSRLGAFLGLFEKHGYEYQIDARGTWSRDDSFQDVAIHAFRA